MYSKNDYRYYLEHRLEESDDYLAHYGVKGMKWKKHKGRDILRKLSGANDFERNMYLTFGKEHAEGITYNTQRAAEKTNSAMLKSIKKQNSPIHRLKEGLKPKNQKAEVVTSPKRKRSKKESDWNNEMKRYAREALNEQGNGTSSKKKRKNKKVEIISFKDQRTGKDYKKKR